MLRWWVEEQRSEREQGLSSVHPKYGQAGPPGAPNWIGKTATTCADLKKLKRSAATLTLILPPYGGTGIFPICPTSPTLYISPPLGFGQSLGDPKIPWNPPFLPPQALHSQPPLAWATGSGVWPHRGSVGLEQPVRRRRAYREGGRQALAGQRGGQGQTPQTLQFPCESTILLNRIMDFKMP